MWLQEVELVSKSVILRPLRETHIEALVQAAADGCLWELWFTGVPSKESASAYVKQALLDQEKGLALPFVVIDRATNTVIGSTRFCNADLKNQRVEIGYTWYAKSFQRSSVNTECKQLLLTHAFETLEAIAVEFRTHWHNLASRQAIARLGAKQDGVLRNHQKSPEGIYRDTVVFSIIDHEWPAVKCSLASKLARYR